MRNSDKALVMVFLLLGSRALMAAGTEAGAEEYAQPPRITESATKEEKPELPEEYSRNLDLADTSRQMIEEVRLGLEQAMVVSRPW